MKKLFFVVALLTCVVIPTYSYATDTEVTNAPKAAVVNPELAAIKMFYTLLSNQDTDAAILKEKAKAIVDLNWVDIPGGQGLDYFANTFAAYHQAIPDMKWAPQRIYKSGHIYTVRSIGSGTPVFDFLNIGSSWIQGKRFEIMSIDIHTVKNGKIIRSYHVEDWRDAIRQLTTN